jgi:hypothetical protein
MGRLVGVGDGNRVSVGARVAVSGREVDEAGAIVDVEGGVVIVTSAA